MFVLLERVWLFLVSTRKFLRIKHTDVLRLPLCVNNRVRQMKWHNRELENRHLKNHRMLHWSSLRMLPVLSAKMNTFDLKKTHCESEQKFFC